MNRTISRSRSPWVARFAAVVLLVAAIAQAQSAPPPPLPPVPISDAILSRIPSEYREQARKLALADTDENQQKQLKAAERDADGEVLARYVVRQLAKDDAGLRYLLERIGTEPSVKLRVQLVASIADAYARAPSEVKSEVKAVLARQATADADATVSLRALLELQGLRKNDLKELLRKLPDNDEKIADDVDRMLAARIRLARERGDASGMAVLGRQETLWITQRAEVLLPTFLQVPPPVFSVTPADRPVRVLAFGDFGTGSQAQRNLATDMAAAHQRKPFDFGLTLGDNFYVRGMDDLDDPRWQSQWEQLYGPLHIQFYACLGNHDWGRQADAPAAEILYSARSPSWRMPAPYFTFTAGPVQFFAINTSALSETQLLWLDAAIQQSKARWKVVYGHHTICSAGTDTQSVVAKVLPLLRHRVDLYLCGHDHNLQELRPIDGVHFFVSGGGGADLYEMRADDPRSMFKDSAHGFTVLEADARELKLTFIGSGGKELHSDTIR